MTIPFVHSQQVWLDKVLTETKELDSEFERCEVVIIEIATTGFTGTLDIKGKLHEGGTFANVPYIRGDQATTQSKSVAQIPYSADTAVYRYAILGYWRRLELVMTRSAGSVSCVVAGSSNGSILPFVSSSGSCNVSATRAAEIDTILGIVQALAASSAIPYLFWASGPPTVEDNAVQAHRLVIDIVGIDGVPVSANLAVGTISITRIRAGVATLIVNGVACSKANGQIYYDYTFTKASWQAADEYRAEFLDQTVTILGTTYSLPPITLQGVMGLKSILTTLGTNQGDPSGDTLVSTTLKLGNLARSLATELGARWDSSGDLGTDVAALITYLYSGTDTLHNPMTKLGNLARALATELGTRWDFTGDLGTDIGNLISYLYASGDVLKNPNTKFGNLARTLKLLLGTRWDSSGDLGTDIGNIKTKTDKIINPPFLIPHPAVYTASVVIPIIGSAADQALGTLTIAGIPTGATAVHLFVHFLFGERVNSSGATNSLSGAQNLKVKNNSGTYYTFLSYAGGEYSTPANTQMGGDARKGTVDLIASIVPVNGDVLTFKWALAGAVGANLTLAECQVVAELYVTL